MKPGRELDALVAEKVMGWTNVHRPDSAAAIYWGEPLPGHRGQSPVHPYSTDIAAAWEVVEKLGLSRGAFTVLLAPKGLLEQEAGMAGKWCVGFGQHAAIEDTAPLAICLAALKAVGHAVE